MRVKIFLSMVICTTSIFLISCSSTDITKDANFKTDTLALVNKDIISLKEYEDFYLKNNVPTALQNITDESKQEFLNLLIKYRLKINDAHKKGYDKDPQVIEEIKQYEKSLAVPFALEKDVVEPNVKRWYERRKQNLKIYAIMVRTDFNKPSDTLEKYNFIHSLLDSLKQGANFKKLAMKYSDLASGIESDSGILGYITAGQTVANFEDAIYSLKPGEYTKSPIKLRTGYIVPMLEKIESRSGGRMLAHLLLQFKESTYEDTIKVLDLASELKQKLDDGADFEQLVKQYSDDQDTKHDGGMLGVFERHPSLQPKHLFDIAFDLKMGEVSEPIITNFGIHIMKCINIEPYPSYENAKQNLRDEYNAARHSDDRNSYVNRLKTKYKYTTNLDVLNEFYRSIDTTKKVSAGTWDSLVTTATRHKVLITLDNKKIIVDSIINTINNMQEISEYIFTPTRFQNVMDRLAERFILEHRATFVPSEFSDFKVAMQEYIDGILLYRAEQEAVWDKLVINDEALHAYYEDNKSLFQFSDRVEFAEIFVKSDSLAQVIYKQLTDTLAPPAKKGAKPKKIVPPDFETMVEKYTERESYKEKKGYWGLCEEKDNTLALHALEHQQIGILKPIKFENGWSIVKVYGFHKPTQKSFEECGPELSTRYQESETKRLENLWMESMRAQFSVKIFPEKLEKVFNTKDK
jgi:peptidyl-prolyl cis-trans isomerase SurA